MAWISVRTDMKEKINPQNTYTDIYTKNLQLATAVFWTILQIVIFFHNLIASLQQLCRETFNLDTSTYSSV